MVVVAAGDLVRQRGLVEIGDTDLRLPLGQRADMGAHRMGVAVMRAVDVMHRNLRAGLHQRLQHRDHRRQPHAPGQQHHRPLGSLGQEELARRRGNLQHRPRRLLMQPAEASPCGSRLTEMR